MLATLGIIQSNAKFTGLLDTYSGAVAAYSLRKLRNAYSGSAIRVRRSSDNTEQDIGFDGNGNLNESALTSFVGANSGYVTKWYDQSGNTRDAAQTTSANQPRIVNAGTIEKINGYPYIYFDGSNDLLDAGNNNLGINAGATALTIETYASIVSNISLNFYPAIIARTGNISPYGGWTLNTNINTSSFDMAVNIDGTWKTYANQGGTNATYTTGTVYNINGIYNGTSFKMYKNSSLLSTQNASGAIQYGSSLNNVWIGRNGDYHINARIATVIVYNKVFTDQEIIDKYNSFKTYMGL